VSGALARICAVALLATAFCVSASAHELEFLFNLSGTAEAPPNSSAGTGSARVFMDLDELTMRVEVSFAGLTGTTTAAHIHCCTSVAGTGTAMVATQTPTFVDFPLGVTSGAYDHTFDLKETSSFNPVFIDAQPGKTLSEALNNFALAADAGKAYLNIHTSVVPGGEIRGFLPALFELQPAPATVPLPAAAWLLVSGLGALGACGRRGLPSIRLRERGSRPSSCRPRPPLRVSSTRLC
jgi:CHRD domain